MPPLPLLPLIDSMTTAMLLSFSGKGQIGELYYSLPEARLYTYGGRQSKGVILMHTGEEELSFLTLSEEQFKKKYFLYVPFEELFVPGVFIAQGYHNREGDYKTFNTYQGLIAGYRFKVHSEVWRGSWWERVGPSDSFPSAI